MQTVTRLRKLFTRTQCNACECGDVTNRDVARFQCVNVDAVLEAESCADVSTSSRSLTCLNLLGSFDRDATCDAQDKNAFVPNYWTKRPDPTITDSYPMPTAAEA